MTKKNMNTRRRRRRRARLIRRVLIVFAAILAIAVGCVVFFGQKEHQKSHDDKGGKNRDCPNQNRAQRADVASLGDMDHRLGMLFCACLLTHSHFLLPNGFLSSKDRSLPWSWFLRPRYR